MAHFFDTLFSPGTGYTPDQQGAPEFYTNRGQPSPSGAQGMPSEGSSATTLPDNRGDAVRASLGIHGGGGPFGGQAAPYSPSGVGQGPYGGQPQPEGTGQGPFTARPAQTDQHTFEEPLQSGKVIPEVVAEYQPGKHIPVSIRNNNPAALSLGAKSSFVEGLPGYVGKTARPKSEGGYYAKFATPEAGVHAASELLKSYGSHGYDTPMKIVKRWSTDSSAWGNYATSIAQRLGVSTEDQIDLGDPQVRKAVLMAMSSHESGFGKPVYAENVYDSGVGDTLQDYGTGLNANDQPKTLDDKLIDLALLMGKNG